ncbi:unnamed protein product [Arctia plantaginis]|uniref:Triokinase/FMN cyclase n=1 Tax=Arctia plantaginis TaxID=874455 RepID=A0A8S0ZM93_ARCPL|nr:unnamed protein product [Arctia plantaginis]
MSEVPAKDMLTDVNLLKMSSTKPITKKVINSPETCVDDNLRGVIATFPKLQLHPKHRVITVRNKTDTGRVAILGGGGSGHEPFAAGFVANGGVLVLIGNYTGDRLNFGKAIEKAKISGIKVESLIVGEDVASSENKTGGRGMIAEVLCYKICGALSQRHYDLPTIHKVVAEAVKYMATLGVCLSACSLPGQPPLFEIEHDEIELGAGVHGEAGITKMKMGTAKELVSVILDKIVNHLKLASGDRVVACINNLGGTSIFEMNIISAEINNYFEDKNMVLERIYSGHIKSSLEMHGFQICLLHLNKENGDYWLELIDAPTDSGAWSVGPLSVRSDEPHVDDDTLLTTHGRKTATGPALLPLHQEIFRASLSAAAEDLVKNESLLNKLDSGCGDGDCGTTFKNFGHAVLKYLTTASMEYPSDVLWDLSDIAETDMGGTSGGIYSLGLAAASQTMASAKTNDVGAWLQAWQAAIEAISKYGGADPGDRTMLDTLHAGAEAFKEKIHENLNMLMRETGAAVEMGTRATATMVAKAGRASYVSSSYTKGEDAGARAAATWLHAIFDFILNAM